MEKQTVFGTPLPFVQWAVGVYDETSLEQQTIETYEDDSEWNLKYRQLFKEALRLVDALKLSSKYEGERSRLIKIIQDAESEDRKERKKAFRSHLQSEEMIKWRTDMSNLFAGLRSPDPEQKAGFHALMDELDLWQKSPREIPNALLRTLERAKLPKGRKSIATPWANVTDHMNAMRLAVASGVGVAEASRVQARLERMAGEEERARTLAKLYRQKMALRE